MLVELAALQYEALASLLLHHHHLSTIHLDRRGNGFLVLADAAVGLIGRGLVVGRAST